MTDLFPEDETVESTALTTVDRDTSPLSILDQLMERGSSVDELAKLFELQREHEKWQAEKAFAKAMIECQAEMPDITRNKFNTQTSSWYSDIESVHKAIKPIYMKHGFSCSHDQGQSDKPDHYRWICHVMHVGGHSRDYHIDLPNDDEGIKGGKCKTAVQGAASSGTYAQRYLECRAFDVTIPWLDRDGNRVGAPVRTITAEEVTKLQDLIDFKRLNPKRVLDWAQIDSLGQMPADKYAMAVDFINSFGKPK